MVERSAHYYFTVKANQPTLEQDIALYFQDRKKPDFVEHTPPDHGRIETRSIWTTTELNAYLDFPHVGQAFVIERQTVDKKTGKRSHEIAYGLTSRSPQQADPKRVLQVNRGHWTIENTCHYVLDWVYDEDRCRIRTGHGPENISRLRRFAISLIKARGVTNVAQKIRGPQLEPKAALRLPPDDGKLLPRQAHLTRHDREPISRDPLPDPYRSYYCNVINMYQAAGGATRVFLSPLPQE